MKIEKLPQSKSWYKLILEKTEHFSKPNHFKNKLEQKLKLKKFDFNKPWMEYASNYKCFVIHQNAVNLAQNLLDKEQPTFAFN